MKSYLRSWCGQHWKQGDNPCPSHSAADPEESDFGFLFSVKEGTWRFHMRILTGKCLGWFSEPTKKGSAFGSFSFGHLSGCVPTTLLLLLEAATYVQLGIFGIWGTGGGVLHMHEIPWKPASSREGVPGESSQIIAAQLVTGRGGSSQTTTH